jgi:hypothetical protein
MARELMPTCSCRLVCQAPPWRMGPKASRAEDTSRAGRARTPATALTPTARSPSLPADVRMCLLIRSDLPPYSPHIRAFPSLCVSFLLQRLGDSTVWCAPF